MKSISSLRKTMISGTIAAAMLSANIPAGIMASAVSADAPNTEVSSEIARAIYEAPFEDASLVLSPSVSEEISEDTAASEAKAEQEAVKAAPVLEAPEIPVAKTSKVSMAEENGYKYYVTAGSAVIDTYTGEDTDVVIPETLGGFTVAEIGYAAFSGNTSITSIKIPATVTRINHDAFNGCTALSDINIPDSVASIQDGAFSGCSALTAIEIPESVSRIEDNTFWGCSALSEVKLNSSIDYIGKSSFANCLALSSFDIPASVTAIGNLAFSGSGLTAMEIPETVTSLGYAVFAECAQLTEVKLPDTIKELRSGQGFGMFSNCSALEKVTFPAYLEKLGSSTFSGCSSLASLTLPETVTAIGSSAFEGCSSLEAFAVPSQVTSIDTAVFKGCSSLASVTLGDNVTSLGTSAFENCSALEAFRFPKSIESVGENCFYNCDSITEFNVPASVTSIGSGAFAGCDSLKKAALPDTITALSSSGERGLFTDDAALTDVKLPAALTDVGDSTFKNCSSLAEITLPETVSALGSAAFEGCISLAGITIPDAVTLIPANAFSGCSSLSKAVLPANIDQIGNYAFAGCSVLSDIGEKAGFFKFAEFTFKGCSMLNDERATVFTSESPVTSVSSATKLAGGLANFTIKYDLNSWICSGFADSDNADIRFELGLPEGLSVIESSVLADSEDNKVTFIGNTGLVSVTKPTGTLRFSARIDAYKDSDYIISPRMHFNSHSYNWTQSLPEMALTVPKLTISSQSTVNDRTCNVYGIAEPGKRVKIYSGDTLLGEALANKYTGKYVVDVTLPETEESAVYTLNAVCGSEKTDEITVKYSNTKPSIKKVELVYCTHPPTSINKYMETLDITGVFTRGERPLIQYYPAGNMRFKITATNAENISAILVRSKKGDESKYLWAEYDENEGAFITAEDKYFDESNHNYVPGSLNFMIFTKSKDVLTEEMVEKVKNSVDLSKFDSECIKVDDNSSIARLKTKEGDTLTDCYYYSAEGVTINGVDVPASTIAENPSEYGFRESGTKVEQNGEIYTVYNRTITPETSSTASTPSPAAASTPASTFSSSVVSQVDNAFTGAGNSNYTTNDYTVITQVMVPASGNSPSRINVTASAAQPLTSGVTTNYRPLVINGTTGTVRPAASYSGGTTSGTPTGTGNNNNNNNNNNSSFSSRVYDYTETAQGYLDFGASIYFIDDEGTSLGSTYNFISGLASTARANGRATDRYNEVVSGFDPNHPNYEWDMRTAEIERNTTVLLSLTSWILSPIDCGYYSTLLGGLSDELNDFWDAARSHYDQIAEAGAALDEVMGGGEEGEEGEGSNAEYDNDGSINTIVDPSGIVYEGVKAKTVSGAVMTCYVFDEEAGVWKVWNAVDYDQINPRITGEEGSYAWDVPEGRYYVTCEVPGCDIIKSEEFTVAPPKYDLDFNILNKTAPEVKNYVLEDNKVIVEFTKVMDIETINKDSVSVAGCIGDLTIIPELYAPDDEYSDKFLISGDFGSSLTLDLSINGNALDYTGTSLTEYFSRIDNIYADLELNLEAIDLIPGETAALSGNKKVAAYTSTDPKVAAVDENGVITAVSEGTATIRAVDEYGKEDSVTVNVLHTVDAEKLLKWAKSDYFLKNHISPEKAEITSIENDKYIITLTDEEGNVLDTYTIDPKTGIGSNSADEEVDLPQTGNNSMTNWLIAFAAMMSTAFGFIAVKASGILRRKKDEQ